jgi:hypothetical protein
MAAKKSVAALAATRIKNADRLLQTRGKLDGKKEPVFKKYSSKHPEKDVEITDYNKSVFDRRLKGIRKAAKRHDYGEAAMLKMYRGLLDMVLDLIPIAERNYRQYKQDRASYALNTLVNQAREIGNDMRTLADFNNQAERIVEMARRQFTLIAQAMVDEAYRLKKEIRDDLPPKKVEKINKRIDALVHGQGKYLNESVKALSDTILSYMTDRRVGGKSVQNGSLNNR